MQPEPGVKQSDAPVTVPGNVRSVLSTTDMDRSLPPGFHLHERARRESEKLTSWMMFLILSFPEFQGFTPPENFPGTPDAPDAPDATPYSSRV